MSITELEKQRCFLYTQAQLEKKVGEEIPRYSSLVQGVRESNDQYLKLKTLETLICLRVQFGSQAQERMPEAIRAYCKDLDLDFEEGKKMIDKIVSWFKLWVESRWPFNLT